MSEKCAVTALQRVVFVALLLAKRAATTLPFVMFTLLCVSNAWAKPDDSYTERPCIKIVERASDRVIVAHNPSCDLRDIPRMFPQLNDETGKPLPMQVQLRSLFAANQDRIVDGKKIRRTVLRGCVRPGKPSPDADAEEKNMCSDGLMNYYSAPADDSVAIVAVPFTPILSFAARMEKLSRRSCATLSAIPQPNAEVQAALVACNKEFVAVAKVSATTDVVSSAAPQTASSAASAAAVASASPVSSGTVLTPVAQTPSLVVDSSMIAISRFRLYVGAFLIVILSCLFGAAIEHLFEKRRLKKQRHEITLPPNEVRKSLIAYEQDAREKSLRISALQQQLTDERDTIKELNERVSGLRALDSDRARKLNAFDDMENKFRESQAKQDEMRRATESVKQEAHARVKKAQADLQNAENANAQLRASNEQLTFRADGLQSEKDELTIHVQNIRNEVNGHRAARTAAEVQLAQEQTVVVALESELAQEQGKNAALRYLEAEIIPLREELLLKNRMIEDLNGRLKSCFEASTGLSTPSSENDTNALSAFSSVNSSTSLSTSSSVESTEALYTERQTEPPQTRPGLGAQEGEFNENERGLVQALMQDPDEASGSSIQPKSESKRWTPVPTVPQRPSYSELIRKKGPINGNGSPSVDDEVPTVVFGRGTLKPPRVPSSSPPELAFVLEALKDPGLFHDAIRGLSSEDFLSALKFKLVALSQVDVMQGFKILAQELVLRRYAGASLEADVGNKEDVLVWHTVANLRLVCVGGYHLQNDGFPGPAPDMRVYHFSPHCFSRSPSEAPEDDSALHVCTITPGTGHSDADSGSMAT